MGNKIKKLTTIFRDVFDNDSLIITPSTEIKKIDGCDSITNISLLAEIQDEFRIKYSIDDITRINTVQDILDSLNGVD